MASQSMMEKLTDALNTTEETAQSVADLAKLLKDSLKNVKSLADYFQPKDSAAPPTKENKQLNPQIDSYLDQAAQMWSHLPKDTRRELIEPLRAEAAGNPNRFVEQVFSMAIVLVGMANPVTSLGTMLSNVIKNQEKIKNELELIKGRLAAIEARLDEDIMRKARIAMMHLYEAANVESPSMKACGGVAAVGVSLILLGGMLQATWKLLYAAGAADVRLMSNLQFVLLAPGFVALLIAAIMLARQMGKKPLPPLMAIAPWKLPFLVVMVLASLAAYGLLAYTAFRRGATWAGAAFVLAFIGILAMGGMSGGEQTIAQQWVEEGVNALGQSAFAAGSFLLYRDFRSKAC